MFLPGKKVIKKQKNPQKIMATVKTHLSLVFLLLDLCLSRSFIRLACKMKPRLEILYSFYSNHGSVVLTLLVQGLLHS